MAYEIKQTLCSACHQCRMECPVGAIRIKNAKYWIDPEKCVSCGSCVKVCHNGCIESDAPKAPIVPHEPIERTCDVCVVGGGGSGMVAAALAADAGLKTVLIEKNWEIGGCATYAAGFRVHYSQWHKELGLPDEREKTYAEFMEKTENKVDGAFVKSMFRANEKFFDWMIDKHHYGENYSYEKGFMGMRTTPKFTWERAHTRIDNMIGPGEGGWFVTTQLLKDYLAEGGEVFYKTEGKHLITDDSGAVVGIECEDEGGKVIVHCKSVVLATGAFTRNKELMDKFQPLFYDDEGKEPIHIFTVSTDTGDGITMGLELGADVDYENRRVNMFGPMRHPYPCVSLTLALCGSGVNFGSQGNWMNGSALDGHEVSDLVFDPKRYCWRIIDEKIAVSSIDAAMKKPPQSPGMDLPSFLKNWRDVVKEEEEDGAIVIADTLDELAAKLGFDAAQFRKDIEAANEITKNTPPRPAGPFGPGTPPSPVEEGPFYALKLKLFHEDAVGGLVTDPDARVLKDGKPVAGLYACGDTTRGIMIPGDVGVNYLEMVFSALTMAFNEGYMAGEAAINYAKA